MQSIPKNQNGRHPIDDLNALTAVATSHADPAIRLMAGVLAEICTESVAKSKELQFREGMARGSIPSNLTAASSVATANTLSCPD